MIEKIHITIILLFFLLLSCNSDIYVGTYINCNYKYTPFIPDIPYVADTLMLYKNLEFTSGYYGKGVYELDNKNKITLYYNYEMGRARFKTVIKNRMNGKHKIILFKDQNHHYIKIN